VTQSRGTPYPELPGLAGYFLEDSYVLAIRVAAEIIEFELEVVLTPSHPDYIAPVPGEQYCYRRGRLAFANPSRFTFSTAGPVRPAIDAAGERDLGNIDSLFLRDGNYCAEGDWGTIEFASDPPQMVLTTG
jgi:hypothetical protein